MTSIMPLSDGAPDLTDGAVDAFRGIAALLPRLAQPSWYKHVHSGMYHETRHRHEPTSPAIEKAKRREARKAKRSRLARALAGERTRVTRVA